uniref:Actin-related protein 2/3 complex subunit 5 n=1 Tax=Haemonchus placei TaxID=6290 RepID=A0A0N4X0A5_HAEPC
LNSHLQSNRFENALHAALWNIQKLSPDEGDILMKYVYKAMEITPEILNLDLHLSNIFFTCYFARFGPGSIIRVFSDQSRL